MAFCSSCGKKAEDGVRFCSGCGKALDDVSNDNVSSQSGANLTEETKGNNFMNTGNNNIIIAGVVLAILGIGLLLYGNSENNNIVTKLSSYLGSGRTNPGTPWMIGGGIILGIGVILIIKKLIVTRR
jgi:uncharacterized membrane protein YvbJ